MSFINITTPAVEDWEQDLKLRRSTGELRKACIKTGNAVQPPSRIKTAARVEKLRKLMINETITKGIRLDAYIINSQDEHQNEFVAEYDKRREFISGFSGSYGDALVTADKAVLWTDGRLVFYYIVGLNWLFDKNRWFYQV